MLRSTRGYKGSQAVIAEDVTDAAMVESARRITLAIECSRKQIGEGPSATKEALCRAHTEATHYPEEVFCFMALLSDAS